MSSMLRIVDNDELNFATRFVCRNCITCSPIGHPILRQVLRWPILAKISTHALSKVARLRLAASIVLAFVGNSRPWHIETVSNVRRRKQVS